MAKDLVNTKSSIWISIGRVFSSLLLGGVFYFTWLAIFLLASPKNSIIEGLLWLISPIVTGTGFGIGVSIFNRLVNVDDGPFLRLLIWPFVGCIMGALIVYWFGPMLIVFSMLAFGTLSMVIREILGIISKAKE